MSNSVFRKKPMDRQTLPKQRKRMLADDPKVLNPPKKICLDPESHDICVEIEPKCDLCPLLEPKVSKLQSQVTKLLAEVTKLRYKNKLFTQRENRSKIQLAKSKKEKEKIIEEHHAKKF